MFRVYVYCILIIITLLRSVIRKKFYLFVITFAKKYGS